MRESTPRGRVFRPSRGRGQSFLRDASIIESIVRLVAPSPNDTFVEIGAGTGQITLPLAAAGANRILAVEAEPVLALQLREILAKEGVNQVEVIQADYLALDMERELAERSIGRVRIAGNLPYSAASPILLKLLKARRWASDMTLMFQREVAERLTAKPNCRAYGRLSVMTQKETRPALVLSIPPQAFWPRPKVHSALVRLDWRPDEEILFGKAEIFESVVRALFAHRRKNISNNIKALQSSILDRDTLRQGLAQLDIDLARRAETLTVEEFAALSHFCSSPR